MDTLIDIIFELLGGLFEFGPQIAKSKKIPVWVKILLLLLFILMCIAAAGFIIWAGVSLINESSTVFGIIVLLIVPAGIAAIIFKVRKYLKNKVDE